MATDSDVVTNASSALSYISLLNQTIEFIMEIDATVEDVVIQQENFVLASVYLNEIVPILNQLFSKNAPEAGSLIDAIESLNVNVISMKKLVLECSQRSKVYLLMNCHNIVKRLEATMKEIGYALGLIPVNTLELSIHTVKEIENLSVAILATEFRISVIEEQILEKIETGIQERNVDRSYANGLLSLIAKAVESPLERSAMGKIFEEFKHELDTIHLRKDQVECIQMDQIAALLGRADATSTIEEKHEKYITKRNSLGGQLVEPLEAFYCPISGEVMVNPVETSSGHTFERNKIEKWFAEGKDLCPLTMIPVDTSILRPNKNLRLAIEEWKDRNTIIKIGLLKQDLSEANPDILQCLKQLQCICEEKAIHCEWVVFENCLPYLADLLKAKNRDISKGALRVLGILMKANDDVKEIIAGVDTVIPLVVRSLGRQAEERKLAISLLLELSKNSTSLNSIGKVHGCILLLVTMSRSDDNQEAKKAQELLEHLSFSIPFTLQMAKANYFKPLLYLLSSGSEDVKMLMMRTLGEMELTAHIKSELVENGVLSSLLPLLSDINVEMKKEAINALQNLSTVTENGLRMIREGVARPLLNLLKHISFASQSCCEVVVATIMNLSIATKFQETGEVPVTLFETDDDAFRLVSLIGVTTSGIQQKVLKAFQALCHSPEATMVRRVLMECSALRMLVKLCENDNMNVRSNSMNLLSCLVEDCNEAALFESQLDKKSIEIILKAINSFDDDQDVASAVRVIYNLPDGIHIKDWLREARAVSIICSVIKKRSKNKLLTEIAVGALSRLMSPADLDPQRIASGAGVIPILVGLLETGTNVGKMRAAVCLSQFSVNSHALSKKSRQRSRALACFVPPPVPACPIHEGICSVETSFCLLEADAVEPLVKILAESDEAGCEASLDALLTLIDGPRLEEGCKVLAEAEATPLIIKLLSSASQSLQEKALVAVERIFRVAEYNAKYESSAQLALVDIASRGTMSMRSLAAKTLAHLHVLYDQSSYF